MKKQIKTIPRYEVLRDTSEQTGWWFDESDDCIGTTPHNMFTADYTLRGLEDIFIIERKHSTSEFATNINEKRFVDELERMEAFQHAYLFLDFSMKTVLDFPQDSGIPRKIWPKLKVSGKYMLGKILDYSLKYKTQIIFTDGRGKEVATALFKKVWAAYNHRCFPR